MYILRFDMRAPSWGAPPAALYAAVPEMCSWAEEHGGLAAVLCEHHGSEDGYLPSPMILAPAIAARTERLAMNLILILAVLRPGPAGRGHVDPRHPQRWAASTTPWLLAIGPRSSSTSAWRSKSAAGSPTRSSGCCAGCSPREPLKRTDAGST